MMTATALPVGCGQVMLRSAFLTGKITYGVAVRKVATPIAHG
jgi:hypothetical protein